MLFSSTEQTHNVEDQVRAVVLSHVFPPIGSDPCSVLKGQKLLPLTLGEPKNKFNFQFQFRFLDQKLLKELSPKAVAMLPPWSSLYGSGSMLYLAGSICYTVGSASLDLANFTHAGAKTEPFLTNMCFLRVSARNTKQEINVLSLGGRVGLA